MTPNKNSLTAADVSEYMAFPFLWRTKSYANSMMS